MNVYLSCPISCATRQMWLDASSATSRLRKAGHRVINPWELEQLFGEPMTLEATRQRVREFLQRDLQEVAACEALVLLYYDNLPMWGSGAEIGLAFSREIPIIVVAQFPDTVPISLQAMADEVIEYGNLTDVVNALSRKEKSA